MIFTEIKRIMIYKDRYLSSHQRFVLDALHTHQELLGKNSFSIPEIEKATMISYKKLTKKNGPIEKLQDWGLIKKTKVKLIGNGMRKSVSTNTKIIMGIKDMRQSVSITLNNKEFSMVKTKTERKMIIEEEPKIIREGLIENGKLFYTQENWFKSCIRSILFKVLS